MDFKATPVIIIMGLQTNRGNPEQYIVTVAQRMYVSMYIRSDRMDICLGYTQMRIQTYTHIYTHMWKREFFIFILHKKFPGRYSIK